MHLSKFGKRFSRHSGIVQLMEDLGDAMTGHEQIFMLGGGNPAHIPEVQQIFERCMQQLLREPDKFRHVIGDYDSPQGESGFISELAKLFHRHYGWKIGPENIALTTGSQSAFFMLFNMFAGEYEDGSNRKILLPLTPEYIGYDNIGLSDNFLTAMKPVIHKLDDHLFKYHVDFNHLKIGEDIGAICVSRPTNPTGNVLSDTEMEHLGRLAGKHNVPFIVDNAYGLPFPGIVFTDAGLYRDENTILCMSLSKLGLPGARTGIVIAREDIVASITRMNAILSLALGSLGPALALEMVRSGEILTLSQNVIKPYYQRKAAFASSLLRNALQGIDFYIHKPEGAIFLWLWFPGLPTGSDKLYTRLKSRNVLVVPGDHFFPGLDEPWRHRHECLRISYAMDDSLVEQGIQIIAEEVRKIVACTL